MVRGGQMSAARETPISAVGRLTVVGPNAITVTESEGVVVP